MQYSEKFMEEEDELLRAFLNQSFVVPAIKVNMTTYISSDPVFKLSTQFDTLELIIDSRCSHNCKYCYLVNHRDEIAVDVPKEQMIENLKAIMEYYTVEKQYLFKTYDLYSGNLFSSGVIFDCLDVMYYYLNIIYTKMPDWKFKKEYIELLIPCDYDTFINDQDKVDKLLDYHKKFLEIGVAMNLSWSHDGKYSNTREDMAKFTDEYYAKCFSFCNATNSGIHAMISPANVQNAKENYLWWEESFKKYLPDRYNNRIYGPDLLEVRDTGWDKDSIQTFEDYTSWRIEYMLNKFNSPTDFCNFIYKSDDISQIEFCKSNIDIFDPIFLTKTFDSDDMRCTFTRSIMVRVGDLAIVPCHRTAYPQFVGGWFIKNDEGKIIDVKAHNISQLITMKTRKTTMDPLCVICEYREFCMQGCLGSQYETNCELYLPVYDVCKMQQAKIKAELSTYQKLGIIDAMKECGGQIEAQADRIEVVYDRITNQKDDGGCVNGCCSCG